MWTTWRSISEVYSQISFGTPSESPPNFTLKLVRPDVGPAAELPTSSPA
jgi:hypothetical protein